MDWFLYDNGLRHERVNIRSEILRRSHTMQRFVNTFGHCNFRAVFFTLHLITAFSSVNLNYNRLWAFKFNSTSLDPQKIFPDFAP